MAPCARGAEDLKRLWSDGLWNHLVRERRSLAARLTVALLRVTGVLSGSWLSVRQRPFRMVIGTLRWNGQSTRMGGTLREWGYATFVIDSLVAG